MRTVYQLPKNQTLESLQELLEETHQESYEGLDEEDFCEAIIDAAHIVTLADLPKATMEPIIQFYTDAFDVEVEELERLLLIKVIETVEQIENQIVHEINIVNVYSELDDETRLWHLLDFSSADESVDMAFIRVSEAVFKEAGLIGIGELFEQLLSNPNNQITKVDSDTIKAFIINDEDYLMDWICTKSPITGDTNLVLLEVQNLHAVLQLLLEVDERMNPLFKLTLHSPSGSAVKPIELGEFESIHEAILYVSRMIEFTGNSIVEN